MPLAIQDVIEDGLSHTTEYNDPQAPFLLLEQALQVGGISNRTWSAFEKVVLSIISQRDDGVVPNYLLLAIVRSCDPLDLQNQVEERLAALNTGDDRGIPYVMLLAQNLDRSGNSNKHKMILDHARFWFRHRNYQVKRSSMCVALHYADDAERRILLHVIMDIGLLSVRAIEGELYLIPVMKRFLTYQISIDCEMISEHLDRAVYPAVSLVRMKSALSIFRLLKQYDLGIQDEVRTKMADIARNSVFESLRVEAARLFGKVEPPVFLPLNEVVCTNQENLIEGWVATHSISFEEAMTNLRAVWIAEFEQSEFVKQPILGWIVVLNYLVKSGGSTNEDIDMLLGITKQCYAWLMDASMAVAAGDSRDEQDSARIVWRCFVLTWLV
jgi:hypothetical protein